MGFSSYLGKRELRRKLIGNLSRRLRLKKED
jgi:hypothetical protein